MESTGGDEKIRGSVFAKSKDAEKKWSKYAPPMIWNFIAGYWLDYVKGRADFDLEWGCKGQTFDHDH